LFEPEPDPGQSIGKYVSKTYFPKFSKTYPTQNCGEHALVDRWLMVRKCLIITRNLEGADRRCFRSNSHDQIIT